MSSPNYLNTNSIGNNKTIAAEGERTNIEGYNLPISQSVTMNSDLKHETLLIPSMSTPAFGGFFSCHIREKNIIIHNASLQLVLSNVGGTSLTGYFVPAYFFYTKIEVLSGGIVLDTIYNTETFLRTNTLHQDEDRLSMNSSAGLYSSVQQRTNMSSQSTPNTFIVSLSSLIDQCKLNLVNNSHALEIRVYMDNLANIYTITSGSNLTASILSATLVCKVTRLDQSSSLQKLNSMAEDPFDNIFHETLISSNVVPSGLITSTIVLNQFVGNISHFIFVVRPLATATLGVGFYTFLQIASFALLDSGGSTISGTITAALASTLNRDWIASSYNVENSLSVVDNGANFYMWSHSPDPVSALRAGLSLGSKRYSGSEQLVINFRSVLTTPVVIDVYGYREAFMETSLLGIKKR